MYKRQVSLRRDNSAQIRPIRGIRVLFLLNLRDVVAGAGPVSYTHLRAHETVLDLVCRLLLEKKNTDNTISGLSA